MNFLLFWCKRFPELSVKAYTLSAGEWQALSSLLPSAWTLRVIDAVPTDY
jgi:hypothetical protein